MFVRLKEHFRMNAGPHLQIGQIIRVVALEKASNYQLCIAAPWRGARKPISRHCSYYDSQFFSSYEEAYGIFWIDRTYVEDIKMENNEDALPFLKKEDPYVG